MKHEYACTLSELLLCILLAVIKKLIYVLCAIMQVLPPVPPVDVTLEPHHQTLPVGIILSVKFFASHLKMPSFLGSALVI